MFTWSTAKADPVEPAPRKNGPFSFTPSAAAGAGAAQHKNLFASASPKKSPLTGAPAFNSRFTVSTPVKSEEKKFHYVSPQALPPLSVAASPFLQKVASASPSSAPAATAPMALPTFVFKARTILEGCLTLCLGMHHHPVRLCTELEACISALDTTLAPLPTGAQQQALFTSPSAVADLASLTSVAVRELHKVVERVAAVTMAAAFTATGGADQLTSSSSSLVAHLVAEVYRLLSVIPLVFHRKGVALPPADYALWLSSLASWAQMQPAATTEETTKKGPKPSSSSSSSASSSSSSSAASSSSSASFSSSSASSSSSSSSSSWSSSSSSSSSSAAVAAAAAASASASAEATATTTPISYSYLHPHKHSALALLEEEVTTFIAPRMDEWLKEMQLERKALCRRISPFSGSPVNGTALEAFLGNVGYEFPLRLAQRVHHLLGTDQGSRELGLHLTDTHFPDAVTHIIVDYIDPAAKAILSGGASAGVVPATSSSSSSARGGFKPSLRGGMSPTGEGLAVNAFPATFANPQPEYTPPAGGFRFVPQQQQQQQHAWQQAKPLKPAVQEFNPFDIFQQVAASSTKTSVRNGMPADADEW